MPIFSAPDGTELAYHVMGQGEPLLCLPGGPMRASAYLGDLGGLSRHRRLFLLDLRGTGDSAVPADPATYRCDRQVDDVEAFRAHLGWERVDLLAHSAAGDLALLYAARYPDRIRTLTSVAGRARALGIDFTEEHRREAAARRGAEPWFVAARRLRTDLGGLDGRCRLGRRRPVLLRPLGRDRAGARRDRGRTDQRGGRGPVRVPGAFEPSVARAAVATLDARVLLLAGELDSGHCRAWPPPWRSCSPRGS